MAYMTIAQMRDYLSRLYGPSWGERVRKMGDRQVAAVYNKHISQKENKK